MSTAVIQTKNKLPNGRTIQLFDGTRNTLRHEDRCSVFKQDDMFNLRFSGSYVLATEGIMSVKDHDHSLQSGAHESIKCFEKCWRTGEYGFYPKGFERKSLPIGNEIVFVENSIKYIFEVPDVPVKIANGETVGLRQAVGMGVIKLEKLRRDSRYGRAYVSVTTDFDPLTDLKVVDVMRPRDWALVDEDGYPLRIKPSSEGVPEARLSSVRHFDDFEDEATGWHGSLVRMVQPRDFYMPEVWRHIFIDSEWSSLSGVALVGREANIREEAGKIIIEGSREQIAAVARLLEQLKRGEPEKEFIPQSQPSLDELKINFK